MRTTYDTIAGNMISLYLCLHMTNVTAKLFVKNDGLGMLINIIIGVIFLFAYFFYYFKSSMLQIRLFIFLCMFTGILYLVAIPLTSLDSFHLYKKMYWTFCFCIPLFTTASTVRNMHILVESMKRAAWYCMFLALPVGVCVLYNREILRNPIYSMSFGYAFLPSELVFMYCTQTNKGVKKFLYGLVSVLGLLIILVYGSRGQILGIAVYALYYSMFIRKINYKIWILLFSLPIFFWMFHEQIEDLCKVWIDRGGIFSRSLYYFIYKTSYTGREMVWREVVDRILEKPIFGWGYATYVGLTPILPHNFFLNIMLQFGIVIGCACGIIIFLLILKKLFFDGIHDSIMMIFCSCGFCPLLLSSEYLVWPLFWFFLALCIFYKGNKNYRHHC